MVGAYYTTEDDFQSTLILNNKGPNQIMVTPILHSRSGQTFTDSPVAVGGESSQEVDLNLLARVAGPRFSSGSFECAYEGRILELGAGLRIVNVEKSLIFDEQMYDPATRFPSSQLEAVYAVPFEDSQVSVIVTNTTAHPIIVNGDAVFAGVNGHHPIQGWLGAHETKIVNLPRGLVKKASAGAVSLNHNGYKGALLAMIHLQSTDRGYSEAVNFANPGGKTSERHGAGLRLGSVNNDSLKPVIAVRNIGESATTVTATVPYSKQNGDTGTIALPQVSLAPGAIKLLDTSNPQLKRGSNLKTLAPSQTMIFDVRKIRDTQQVGSEGNTVPSDAGAGHIVWKLRGARDKVLIGRAQTVVPRATAGCNLLWVSDAVVRRMGGH